MVSPTSIPSTSIGSTPMISIDPTRAKICRVCQKPKSLGEFYARGEPNRAHRYRSECKACCHKRTERNRRRNYEQHLTRTREAHLKRKYGISQQEYEALLEQQSGVCAICCNPPGRRRLHVDHDHSTGIIR